MRDKSKVVQVGLLVVVALAVLAGGIFLIGEESSLFVERNHYRVELPSAEGLQSGNPVQVSGVRVGSVDEVILPEDPANPFLEVQISIDRRYARRIRQDSRASVKTLGLLGDKYVEVSAGTPSAEAIPDGGEIHAAKASGFDQLMESSGSVAQDIESISASLAELLDRLQRGEGVIGDLLSPARTHGRSASEEVFALVESTQGLGDRVEAGQGTLGRLLSDRELADQLARSVGRLENVLAQVENGDGLVPALVNDPALTEQFRNTLDNLDSSSRELAQAAGELSRTFQEGDGLVPRLLLDEEYGRRVSEDLEQLLERLNRASQLMTEGDGSVAQLLRDPHIYQSLEDIVAGVNDSKLLTWLIRNRQRQGAKERLEEIQETTGELPESPYPAPAALPSEDPAPDDPAGGA